MKIQIDNVEKRHREYFKAEILKAIEGEGNVYFAQDKAIIETVEGYIITDETLLLKNNRKKAIYKTIENFRIYQFNNAR